MRKMLKKVLQSARDKLGNLKIIHFIFGGIVIFKDKIPEDYYLKECDIYKKNDSIKLKGQQIKLNKDDVEDNGLIKIDILSNKGLSQLWDISHKNILDYDFTDKNVFNYLSKGENLGITLRENQEE